MPGLLFIILSNFTFIKIRNSELFGNVISIGNAVLILLPLPFISVATIPPSEDIRIFFTFSIIRYVSHSYFVTLFLVTHFSTKLTAPYIKKAQMANTTTPIITRSNLKT